MKLMLTRVHLLRAGRRWLKYLNPKQDYGGGGTNLTTTSIGQLRQEDEARVNAQTTRQREVQAETVKFRNLPLGS